MNPELLPKTPLPNVNATELIEAARAVTTLAKTASATAVKLGELSDAVTACLSWNVQIAFVFGMAAMLGIVLIWNRQK